MARLAGVPWGPRWVLDGERPEVSERGLNALLRLDLHAMLRLLNDQPLTVADILSARDCPRR